MHYTYYYYGPSEWTHKISIIHWQICGFPRSRPYNLPWSSFLFKHHPPAAVCVLGWSSEPCVYFGNFLLLCQRLLLSAQCGNILQIHIFSTDPTLIKQMWLFDQNIIDVKFLFSTKATKIDKIFTVDLSLCSKCQIAS